MNAQEAQTLNPRACRLDPDGTKAEVIPVDGSGVKVRWEDDQCGYYQFTDLLSQIERSPWAALHFLSRHTIGRSPNSCVMRGHLGFTACHLHMQPPDALW
jgi:hypothetical protein